MDTDLLAPVRGFLGCATPKAWLDAAEQALPLLLIDHCNCELKAAQAAIRLMRRYGDNDQDLLAWVAPYEAVAFGRMAPEDLLAQPGAGRVPLPTQRSELTDKLHLLVREELHHFRQVLALMQSRGVDYRHVSAGRYAVELRRHCRNQEPARQVDLLIIGAFIEARSCERFAALIPRVDPELGAFYHSLLRSEARHFEDYLTLARQLEGEGLEERVARFAQWEAELIQSPDPLFRFHSGVPV
ncbi:tRNA-(ms[2]io[6]A)-hydroxylase [Ferrimonas marina]|uniref:tRNA-(Ms[2]io[6]A)-hydroxylase n=1 Tax=Ferrimonas marina TaxID=299255 RepID=A0A1M5Y909_9GAMM|nr:tRNA isopentenyl-2-thiomethyl-A-37 hydroxylase MiaE [Ferrimonas marina]SHI08551.1 tRNA-(ms[2]io[6]A)-hydroxylase [Ferrimonas marina]